MPSSSVHVMKREPPTLLSVEPSVSQRALVGELARKFGLRLRSCADEADALAALEEETGLALMVIANHLTEGESLHVIGAARVSPHHAALPIAFMMASHDDTLARQAFEAGATGVFLRGENDALLEFVGDAVAAQDVPIFGGRLLLLEDSLSHARYVEHLCIALGMQVDIAASVDAALEMHAAYAYQMYVVDIVLQGTGSGIEFVRTIRRRGAPSAPVLVMSAFDDPSRRVAALRAGADDFISKPFPAEEFIWRVKRAMHVSDMREGTADAAAGASGNPQRGFVDRLSTREHEILGFLLVGTSDKDIAAQLGISYWTVRSHIQKIFTKSGATNRRDLMARFIH